MEVEGETSKRRGKRAVEMMRIYSKLPPVGVARCVVVAVHHDAREEGK
jgi:hypothetical protein